MAKRKTAQSKRFVTEDKKERFKEIVADNKEFLTLVHKFTEVEPNKQTIDKQSASNIKNKRDNNN